MNTVTAHFEHDTFLLMLNLSQIKSSERIRHLFLEAMNSFWEGIHLRFSVEEQNTQETVFDISTRHHRFGYIVVEGRVEGLLIDELALIRNTIGMLAIILENRLQETLLAEENSRLDVMVQERTADLIRMNTELKTEIAERKRVEEQIRQYADIVGKMQIGLHVYHLEDRDDDGSLRMVAVNAAATEILSLDMNEILGKTLDENFPALREQRIPQKYAEIVRSGTPAYWESLSYGDDRIQFAAFSVRAFPIPGDCVAVLFEDITERRHSEMRIRYLANLVENVSDAVISSDMDFTIKSWNKGAESIYGWKAEEVLGKTVGEVIRIEYPYDTQEGVLAQFLQSGSWKGEIRQKHRNGRTLNILASVSLLRDENGTPNGAVAINRDISERKRAAEEIFTLNAELEQRVAQRTAELEEVNQELKHFAYVVSHDLKAPLRGIHQLSQWFVEDYADAFDESGKKMLVLLSSRVKRMSDLIDGILQYSRIGHLSEQQECIELNLLVKEVVEMLAPPESIQVIVENALPTLVADKTRLQQIFQNLVSNALRYMDKTEGTIVIHCVMENEYWRFSVADNGPGIEPRHHERIFQIFQSLQAKDEHESTGIGLALVKRIVELYGGKVWVESSPGQGSIFSFTLPRSMEARSGETLY